MRHRRDLLRRYPSLAFVALAVALAATLPSALNLPTSGPAELAELAPVPPDDEDAPPQQGDLSALGEAGSEGLGAGVGSGAAPPPPPPPPPGPVGGPDQGEPAFKRCVGDPPRQTEDPLSPPCVKFFAGDNGGATSRGVTGSEVLLVAAVRRGNGSGPPVDYTEPDHLDDFDIDRALRAYNRYVNDRYQTWGRRIRIIGYPLPTTVGVEEARAHALAIDELQPFGVFLVSDDTARGHHVIAVEAARRGMLSVVYDGLDPAQYRQAAPLLLSFRPDLQEQAAIAAGYACRRLAGTGPSHAGPLTRTDPVTGAPRERRRLGIVYTDSDADPEHRLVARLFEDQVRGCDLEVAEPHAMSEMSATTASAAMASFDGDGVTTVVPFLEAQGRAQVPLAAQNRVTWEPEWFVAGVPGVDIAGFVRTYGSEWERAFGLTTDYRRDVIDKQPHVVAFSDACPGCPLPVGYALPRGYDALMLLMRAIQAAGPQLTPHNAERGLRAIEPHSSTQPDRPAAFFAPGNYSFLKDAMEIWWDPRAVPPGGNAPTGCYRLPREGQRFQASQWPVGDDGLFAGQPICQAAPIREREG